MIDRLGERQRWRRCGWLALLLLVGRMASVQAGSVYQCVDGDGAVTFRDRPCAATASQSEVVLAPAPAVSPATKRAADEKANMSGPRPAKRAAGSRRTDSAAATSYECRTADGQVFYRHRACPKSVPALDRGSGKHPGRSAGAKNSATSVAVISTRIPREEACYELRRGGATGRLGRDHDQDASTYDKNLGRDPCR